MSEDHRGMSAWMDGHLVSGSAAAVPVWDRGFLHGDGCFEDMRIRGIPELSGAPTPGHETER
jgi:branched-subunit amino acid aminotransferase/4-amino-4-deoxychorismate lyase